MACTESCTTTLIDVGIQTETIDDKKFISDSIIFIPGNYYTRMLETEQANQLIKIIKDVNWEQEMFRLKSLGTSIKRKRPYEEEDDNSEKKIKSEKTRQEVSVQAGIDFASVYHETDQYEYKEYI